MSLLVVCDPVPEEKNPTNTFRFVVSQMSGDADAWAKEEFDISIAEEALAFTLLLRAISEAQSSGYNRKSSEVYDEISKTLSEETIILACGNTDVLDQIAQICGYDVTYEGYPSSLDSYDIFWFNKDGIKHHVEFVK